MTAIHRSVCTDLCTLEYILRPNSLITTVDEDMELLFPLHMKVRQGFDCQP